MTNDTDKTNELHKEINPMNDHTAGQADEQNRDSDLNMDQDTNGAEMMLDQALLRLSEAEALIAGHQTEVLRLHADAQNIRRRAEQDVEKAHKYGQERLLSELLPVIDNLERALQASGVEENELLTALKQGVELTLKSFVDCLRKFNVDVLDPVGEPFDPLFHQAIGMVESKTAEPDSVLAVMQKGYSLNGRVLRPAMVMVARAPTGSIDIKA
ncbi:MAG: nucleotide exchange factor GrpE [Pseudohongiella sp.]|nr:nucleotide exchange factor GrpE [Pseudohongiella sp.]MDP2091461.1 nucleotide exchange factor GrpE [Pseudohongiella sp.]